jgi:hypothetical protein
MREPPTPLYVRLAADQARRLDQAASASGKSKRRLIEDAVREHLTDDGLTVGRVAFANPGGLENVAAREDPPEILTAGEAAALLRIDEQELVAAAERHELPARAIAGAWRFSRSALLSWLGQGATQPGPGDEDRSETVIETGQEYAPGDPVRVRVVHRQQRISITDDGEAVEQAGRAPGWREVAARVADEFVVNVSRHGVISLPLVRGGRLAEHDIVQRIGEASLALYQGLLELDDVST